MKQNNGMDNIALKALAKTIGFKQMPPDIDTFLDDPYYLGSVFTNIYPFWRKKLREIFPDPITITNSVILFTGTIGGGKTTVSEIILAYQICKIACMTNPKKYFKIEAQQGYFVKMFNIYKHKAADFCDEVNSIIFKNKVPFFQREIEAGNEFLNNLHISTAAKPKDMVSNDLILGHLSEINFVKADTARDIINQTFSRISSRFIKGERMFSLMIIDSSTTGPDSPVETYLKSDPKALDTFVVRLSQWDAKSGLGIYGNTGWFRVFIGDGSSDPFVIPDDYPEEKLMALDKDLIIKAPNEVRDLAERDIVLFLTEQAGISTASTSTFIKNKNLLDKVFKINMVSDDVVVLDFFDPYDTLYEYLKDDLATIPIDRKIYIRIDCGYASDNFGLSIAYADGLERNSVNGANVDRIKINIPISIAISRKDGEQTPISKVVDFIIQISQTFQIGCVYSDSHQSTQFRQELIQSGINAEMYSCDRHDEAYRKLKEWIYAGLVDLPTNEILKKELTQLQRIGPDKVDHPPKENGGSKDISDTVAGLVFKMVELGPDEVLGDIEEVITNEITDVYSNISENRRRRLERLNTYSTAESYFGGF